MQAPDVSALLRQYIPQVLGVIARRSGDFADSEDAVQEASLAAARQWSRDGVPEDPKGWLVRVAARRMTDQIRASMARRRREEFVVSLVPPEEQLVLSLDEETEEKDDTLALLFMSCHPALSASSAIALTLRAVGGLTTQEIARAFFVPEATMAQRISRAKQSIKASGVPFQTPSEIECKARLGVVMHVLYLIFNEGYTATSGDALYRVDLSREAIRLTRKLYQFLPEESEVMGLLSLMLLTDARRSARSGPLGEIIPLDEQDRSLWDQAMITEGTALISMALAKGMVGEYQVQAAISALHDEAQSTEETDWTQILGLYGLLRRISDNPMIALNQAVSEAMVHGISAGLARVEALSKDPRLQEHHRLYAVWAHLSERAGEHERAITNYRRAAALTTNTPERNYLLSHAASLSDKLNNRT
jgi:RNA polymerase sigma factor (sigma-70 family)